MYQKIIVLIFIDRFSALKQRFENFLDKGQIQFLLSASLHLHPYSPDPYDFEAFYAKVKKIGENANITVFRNAFDTENKAFEFFNMKEFQVFVLDKCSRISYIIEPPWSLIQYSYVKAGILSTIYDLPCGECNVSSLFLNLKTYLFMKLI